MEGRRSRSTRSRQEGGKKSKGRGRKRNYTKIIIITKQNNYYRTRRLCSLLGVGISESRRKRRNKRRWMRRKRLFGFPGDVGRKERKKRKRRRLHRLYSRPLTTDWNRKRR